METLRVRDLMTQGVLTMTPDDQLSDLRDLMYSRNVRHVPIVDRGGELRGLVSYRDLLRNTLFDRPRISEHVADEILAFLRVEDVMTRHVQTIGPAEPLQRAAEVMLRQRYGCLPVVSDGRLVGILTESDFVRLHAADPKPA